MILLLLGVFAIAQDAGPQPQVVLVSNAIDYSLADDFIGYLRNQGFVVHVIRAWQVSDYKHYSFFIFLGGQNAPDGVGEIVGQIMSGDEKQLLLSYQNSSEMFEHEDYFMDGQKIWVLAGYGMKETEAAHKAHRHEIASTIKNLVGGTEFLTAESPELEDTGGLRLSVGSCATNVVIIDKATSFFTRKDEAQFGYKFLICNLTIMNYLESDVEIDVRKFLVKDDRGRDYRRAKTKFLKNLFASGTLKAGDARSGALAFEVGKKSKAFNINFQHDEYKAGWKEITLVE